MNEWLISSLFLIGIWFVIYATRPSLRKEMFWTSLFTMPLGLTEPLFVPEYWSPPSLFNLAINTGFDIESLIFSFAVGGVGAVLYEAVSGKKHRKISKRDLHSGRYSFHKLALASPIIAFAFLHFLTNLNPIYSASIAMLTGGVLAIVCRRDLTENILLGGLLFMMLYFAFFLLVNLMFPEFINVWNLSEISGILILGVPLEELVFAFTFGILWSSIYEHAKGYKLI